MGANWLPLQMAYAACPVLSAARTAAIRILLPVFMCPPFSNTHQLHPDLMAVEAAARAARPVVPGPAEGGRVVGQASTRSTSQRPDTAREAGRAKSVPSRRSRYRRPNSP